MDNDDIKYVLEYSDKQKAFHIQDVESRAKCKNNDEWKIIFTGDYGSALAEYLMQIKIIGKF